jgi:hypothetical protein
MNLASQEILKYLKAEEPQDEDEILEKNSYLSELILKVRNKTKLNILIKL